MSILPVRSFLLSVMLCMLFFVKSYAQSSSNEGSEFWVAFPTHEADFDKQFNTLNANVSIFLTGRSASSGTVSAGNFNQHFTLIANQVTEVKIPRDQAYINDADAGKILSNRAIHILVDPGQPKIVTYAHIFAGQRSAASLILPKETLGQQYYSMNFKQHDTEGKNYITIVATEPGTRVFLRRGKTDLISGGIMLPLANDVYEYLSSEDLTGVSVTIDTLTSTCKRFAVFSGSSGIKISPGTCDPKSLDPLYQQCYPTDSWGLNYGFIPFATVRPDGVSVSRSAGQYIKVIAQADTTAISIDGQPAATLNAGEVYITPVPLAKPALISGSKPVSVAQFALSQSCANLVNTADTAAQGYSDPDMVILNPIEFNINNITVYSSTRENIKEQYINVLIKTAAAASFQINGAKPVQPFRDYLPLPGYSYLQLNLNGYPVNTFNLTASDGFNAIAYGFGNVESYAYSAGTNLTATQSIVAVKTSPEVIIDSACVNDDYFFRLTLPYISPRISWKMDQHEQPTIQNSPAFITKKNNGRLSYEYTFPKTAAYSFAGDHQITIAADYPTAKANCDFSSQQIMGQFKVLPLPSATIAFTKNDCGDLFTFSGPADTINVKGWLWSFGDTKSGGGNTAEGQKALHNFTDSGTYVIKLTTISKTGCENTTSDTLKIKKSVIPGFSVSGSTCAGQTLVFKDDTQATSFITASRTWTFGDGDSVVVHDNIPVVHRYKSDGRYTASLLLTSNQGCTADVVTRTLTIHKLPLPDFVLPATCLADVAIPFANNTPGSANANNGYTYLWHFGDPAASAAHPDTSTHKNPVHQYVAAGSYQVSLTVFDQNECDSSVTKTIMINGVVPKADFDTPVSAQICIAQPVTFLDKSHVIDFGSITKLEWFFDLGNAPNNMETFTDLHNNRLYTHVYPVFYGPPYTKQVSVKLKAYSGGVCADSLVKQITLTAGAKLQFDSVPPVCINAAPVLLVARETTGIPGDGGKFTGKGILPNGAFDPMIAGIGSHAITYTFITKNNCSYTVRQAIIVTAQPVISPMATQFVKQGENIRLKPIYTGSNLTYKWTPSTALDNDSVAFPYASPAENVTYTVTVSNGTCQAKQSILVNVLKPLVISNIITPNGDGVNDFLTIKNLDEYPLATLDVFNRYGSKIYHTQGNSKPWDGTYNGNQLPAGVYYYVIDLKDGKPVYSGYVTLIK